MGTCKGEIRRLDQRADHNISLEFRKVMNEVSLAVSYPLGHDLPVKGMITSKRSLCAFNIIIENCNLGVITLECWFSH